MKKCLYALLSPQRGKSNSRSVLQKSSQKLKHIFITNFDDAVANNTLQKNREDIIVRESSPESVSTLKATNPHLDEIDRAIARAFHKKFEAPKDKLNPEQSLVLQMALDGASLFIGGKAGTGKSHVLREICKRLQGKGLNVAVTASTGVAALNVGGNTFHSTFSVPVLQQNNHKKERKSKSENTDDDIKETQGNGHKAYRFNEHLLSTIDVLVIDEISLLHGGYLEGLDYAARNCEGREPHKYFGGIQVILSGDFLQLTPFALQKRSTDGEDSLFCKGVEPKAEASKGKQSVQTDKKMVDNCAEQWLSSNKERQSLDYYSNLPMFNSFCFQNALIHVQLEQPSRQVDDPQFVKDLNVLRYGKLPYRISRSAVLNPPDPDAIRLFAVRRSVKAFNDSKMLFLKGKAVSFQSDFSFYIDWRNKDSNLFLSKVLVLHIINHNEALGKKGDRRITDAAARNVVLNYIRELNLSVSADRMLTFIVSNPENMYSQVHRVAVRFSSGTQKEASQLLTEFHRKLSEYVQLQPQVNVEHVAKRAVNGIVKKERGKNAHHFPNTHYRILRCDSIGSTNLIGYVQSAMQKSFMRDMKKDFILQSKELKVGCRVMLLKNLSEKLVNGSTGTIDSFLPLSKCGAFLVPGIRSALSPTCARVYKRIYSNDGETSFIKEDDETLPTEAVVDTSRKNVDTTSEDLKDSLASSKSYGSSGDPLLPIVLMDTDGKRVAIPWVSLPIPGAKFEGFLMARLNCMPLVPAYAFTVHKIQGLTLSSPILFDAKDAFPCNHLVYVAASRVKRFEQLRIVNMSPSIISVHKPSLFFSQGVPRAEDSFKNWQSYLKGNQNAFPHKELSLPTWKQK